MNVTNKRADILVRGYQPSDYSELKKLYLDSSLYGGQFDEARDAEERLQKKIEIDPEAILVAERDGRIVGSISIIEDGRVAWLFRFCVVNQDIDIAQSLKNKAFEVIKLRGHEEVLVYSPLENESLDNRYISLDFNKGNDYTVYWSKI